MRKLAFYSFLSVLLSTQVSCTKDDGVGEPSTEQAGLGDSCVPAMARVVKSATDVAGFVSYDSSLKQYSIVAHQPGTIDVVDIGELCGQLPQSLQVDKTRVLFSGVYREYGVPPIPLPAGYKYYYLDLSKVKVQ